MSTAVSTGTVNINIAPPKVPKEHVRVVARFRPVNDRESKLPEQPNEDFSLLIDERQCLVGLNRLLYPKDRRNANLAVGGTREESHNFVFDKVFGPDTTQQRIFDDVARDVVSWIAEGYNSTIFAYGQTGSGKTYTMFGSETGDYKLRGIIPRSVEQLFQEIAENQEIEEVTLKCSFLEIHKEAIRDLLRPPAKNANDFMPSLRIRQSKEKGCYVQGLIEKYVYSPQDVLDLLKGGMKNRVTSETSMNEVSSRSHAVLSVTVTETWRDGTVRVGKLNLVDLAGSENVSKSHASGETLNEAQKINKSLSALGNVIYALTEQNREHVPYRDSKLTYLLQDSLGGNTKTVLLVACSPHESCYSETLSTLKFAKRAKDIENIPSINKQESVAQLKAVVHHLEQELADREQHVHEMYSILGTFGVERDENGAFKLPKEPRLGQADAKELNQFRAEVIRLNRKLDKAEEQLQAAERARKKEHNQYVQLKELFNRQRDLAVALSEKLRQRDETILLLTRELEEYNEFQGLLEMALASNPGLLAAIGGTAQLAQMRRASQQKAQAIDIKGLNTEPDNPEDYPSEPPSPSESALSANESRQSLNAQALNVRLSPNVAEQLRGSGDVANVGRKSGSARDKDGDAYAAALREKNASRNSAGADARASLRDPAADAAQEAMLATDNLTAIIDYVAGRNPQLAVDLRTAVAILEAGGVFIKYPFGGGLFSKATKKQMFYNKENSHLFYWDVGSKMQTSSKYIPMAQITDIHVGKQTPTFQKSTSKNAKDERCFSIAVAEAKPASGGKGTESPDSSSNAKEHTERTLDLEAETQEMRDRWVAAIKLICEQLKHRADTPILRMHGSVNNEVLKKARVDFNIPDSTDKRATSPNQRELKVVSDYVARDTSELSYNDAEGPYEKKYDGGNETGGGDGDGQDGAGKSKKRVTDLPGYRFKDLDEVDGGKITREDIIHESRHAKDETATIFQSVERVKIDAVSKPVGVKESASDVTGLAEAEEEERAAAAAAKPAAKKEDSKPKSNAASGSASGRDSPRKAASPAAAASSAKSPRAGGSYATKSTSNGSSSDKSSAKAAADKISEEPVAASASPRIDMGGHSRNASSAGAAKAKTAEGRQYKCLYDFQGSNDLQLSFKRGDVVTVLAEKDKGWWTASLDGRVGAIPYNYVKPLEEWEAERAAKRAAKAKAAEQQQQ